MVTHSPNIAVVCDAEQVIHSNIDRANKNKVIYTLGAIEAPQTNTYLVDVLEGNLLKGLLFDAQGTPYTPGYTAKGKKQYRYYISQNLIQMRDHPDGLLGRLPAHEIETTVDDILRAHLRSPEKMSALLNLEQDNNAEVLHKISEIQNSIHMAHLIEVAVEKIKVHSERIEIMLNVQELVQIFVRISRMHIDCHEENATIISPYTTHRAKKGAVVIEPEKPDRDIFDLPPEQLKKLIQGFIWRDEHFSGTAIKEIALRENYSQSYVGTAIFGTFDIPQAA